VVRYKTVYYKIGTLQNGTLQNGTLQNGMLQNVTLQNGTELQNDTVTKWDIVIKGCMHKTVRYETIQLQKG
jgi:hypothetical protein